MTSCFRNKTSVKPIVFVEGIQIVIACIYVKIISNCLARHFEKMQISFVCFLKTRKILITFLTTMYLKTWQKKSSKNFAKRRGRSLITLLWLIWPHQREREREFIGTNIKQFHAKMKLRRWDTEKNLQEVVSSGAPRKFHKFLLWFKVDGRISANLMRL